eukprot:COSAG01_NODE_3797_length_5687_cov_154.085183_4_plen_65_part_00
MMHLGHVSASLRHDFASQVASRVHAKIVKDASGNIHAEIVRQQTNAHVSQTMACGVVTTTNVLM